MSLGFLTESALLPSQAKEIKGVDQKTILDLKAIIYKKEQELSEKGKDGATRMERRGKKRSSGGDDKEDQKQKKNRGVEERQAKDMQAHDEAGEDLSLREKKFRSLQKLKEKAKMYDAMMLSARESDSSLHTTDVQANDAAHSLIDFHGKEYHKDHSFHDKSVSQEVILGFSTGMKDEDDSEWVDIADEFGRTRRVSRYSRDYAEFLNAAQHSKTSDHISDGKDQEAIGTSLLRDERGGSRNGHVVSQWDTTLKSFEKGFLQEVHVETQRARTLLADKKQRKAMRLEKLQQRKQTQTEAKATLAARDNVDAFLNNLAEELN